MLLAFLPVTTAYSVNIGDKFPIATTAETEQTVSIAFDGTNYLMMWHDDINDPDFGEIYGQFISPSGSVVGPPFPISQTASDTGGIAFDGTNYFVVYYNKVLGDTKNKVCGRLVFTGGAVGTEITISTGSGHTSGTNNVAFDGNNYLVAWTDDDNDYEVKGRFVSPSGVLGTEFTVNASLDPSDNFVTIALDGTNYLVAWEDEMGGQGTNAWDLYGQLVTPSGTLTGGLISISTAPGGQHFPFIAFDGTNYLITRII